MMHSAPFQVGLSMPHGLIGIRGRDDRYFQPANYMIARTPPADFERHLPLGESKIVLLQGMPGSGKSATVADLALSRTGYYTSILVLSAHDIRKSFEKLAHQLVPKELIAEETFDNVIQYVYRHLAVWGHVLVVFERPERLQDIGNYLPNLHVLKQCQDAGKDLHVIMASCSLSNNDWDFVGSQRRSFSYSTIPVKLYTFDEAKTYCAKRTEMVKKLDQERSKQWAERSVVPTDQDLEKFRDQVGLLPVALTAACDAVLNEQAVSSDSFQFKELVDSIYQYDTEMPSRRAEQFDQTPVSAFFYDLIPSDLWSITLEYMVPVALNLKSSMKNPHGESARTLLELCCLFTPQRFPKEFIKKLWSNNAVLMYLKDRGLASDEAGMVSIFPLLERKIRDLRSTGQSATTLLNVFDIIKQGLKAFEEILKNDGRVGARVNAIIADLESDKNGISELAEFIEFLRSLLR